MSRLVFLLLSLSGLAAGLYLSASHPVAPMLVTLIFLGAFGLFLWQPRLGVVSLPVFLPLLNFSPWTGWLIVDEFDILVLAVVAAGYWRSHDVGLRRRQASLLFPLAIAAWLVARGAGALAATDLYWFSGYLSALNSLRVGKTLLWLVLLRPLVVQAAGAGSPGEATTAFFAACLIGAGVVVLAVLWERGIYPGLFDMSTPYRTVALFWEMHQGGAALDAYLVLIAPLLVWAWRVATSWLFRVGLGAFILVFVYVCLTTFSRGVLGALVGAMGVLAALLWRARGEGAEVACGLGLGARVMVFLVTLEVALVLGAGSFMSQRLASIEDDVGGRIEHWRQGIGLLKTPDEWLFGIGLGRLPTRLMQGEAGLARPGAFRWSPDGGQNRMAISGPEGANSARLGGLYGLSQRVELVAGQRYRLVMALRSENDVALLVQVCALHLLYPERCVRQILRVSAGGWRRVDTVLAGSSFKTNGRAGRGVFLLSVLTPGGQVAVTNLDLSAGGSNLLRNAQFRKQGAGWFPAARAYFLPWHIDNLYLEILIETGLSGLLFFFVSVGLTLRQLFRACFRGDVLAAYLISSIAGVLALGLFVSVLDMPRVATLFGLFILKSSVNHGEHGEHGVKTMI